MHRVPSWRRIGHRARRQRRALVRGGPLLAISAAMLLWAWRSSGFASDLLLNLGSSVVLAAVSYVIFDPLFDEARKARVQEHTSFDQQTFIDVVEQTSRRVRILDTWTILLERRYRDETLRAIGTALRQGAQVQVLLLDPDCTAAQQRGEELEKQRIDVPGQIRQNLRFLSRYRDGLDAALRRRLEVHIYDASPSIQLYQWDGHALISFFPIGKLSFNVPQLEVDMASPWGEFVHARFEELWQHPQATLDLRDYWSAPVVLQHDDADMAANRLPYVTLGGRHYIDCRTFHLTRQVVDQLTVRAQLPREAGGPAPATFTLAGVPAGETPSPAAVRQAFDDKYGPEPDRMLLRLVLTQD